MFRLGSKQILLMVIAVALLAAVLSFGSFYFPAAELLSRSGGQLSFVPRHVRQVVVEYRTPVGACSSLIFLLVGGLWLGSEVVARLWQKTRNRELASNAVLLRLAPRVDEKSKWEAAADMWAAIYSTLARPGRQVWLGAGMHISLEMVQQAGERITFYLWTPRPVAETLARQFRATYSGLEIETLVKSKAGAPTDERDDYLDAVSAEANWRWADLGLGRDSWRPLRTKFAGDPLPSLLSTLEGLSGGNEVAALHFILRPAAEGWQKGSQEFVSKLRGDTGGGGGLGGMMGGGKKTPAVKKLGSQDRDIIKRIEEKGQARGYDLCLRLVVAGQGEVDNNLQRLVRVFDQFNGDNSMTVRATGTQQELYRVKDRFMPAGWGKSVVSNLELAALAHLPNQDISGIAIARARARLEKPSPVSFVAPGEKRIVIGRFADVPSFGGQIETIAYPFQGLRHLLKLSTPAKNGKDAGGEEPEKERAVGIKLTDTRRHFHVIGPTGVGKSTMLLFMIYQYLTNFPEAAVWLQEPHQDLTHKVIRRVPLWREKDVVWLDVMDPERVIGINPLEAPPDADMGAVVADIMGVIKKVMGASWETAVQMQEILNNSLQAVLAGQPKPTFVHVFKLLTDANYRYDLTYNVADPIATPYWQSLETKKEKELDTMLSVPRRRINAFLKNQVVRRIVAQSSSTLNFREAIDSGKVILVQLDGRMGAENRTFIGTLTMYKLFGAVMSRMDIPEEQRRQVAICVDEFQTFVGQSGEEFADILEQARKMGASLTLAHQHLGQLTRGGGDLINSVANNTGTKIVFRSEASDAPQFLKWLPELTSIVDLTTLANYRCYVRPMVNGSPQNVCTLYTYADPPLIDPVEELRTGRRGEPDPLPPNPGPGALAELKRVISMPSNEARKDYLKTLSPDGWSTYLAARRFYDAVQRNKLIENPGLITDKLQRVRTLVRLKYGTPHYETEAVVECILGAK